MVLPLDPLGNPVGFVQTFFLFNTLADPLAPLKLALYSSVLIFPFVLAGRFVYGRLVRAKLLEGMKTATLWRLLTACFAATVTFWLVTRLWIFAFYREFPAGPAAGILYGILLGTLASTILAGLGLRLLAFMRAKWQMPPLLSVYISELVMSAVFWIAATAYFAWSASSFLAGAA